MRRIIKDIVCFIVLTALIITVSVNTFAEAANIFTEAATSYPGGKIEIAVKIKLDEPVSNGIITIDYDKTVFETSAEDIAPGDVLSDVKLFLPLETETGLSIGFVNTKNFSADGTLFTVAFRVKETAEKNTYSLPVTVKEMFSTENTVNTTVGECKITITDAPIYKPGDVNDDGEIKLADAMIIFNHVAKLEYLDGIMFLAADIDGNGYVQLADAMRVFKFVAKVTEVL